MFIAIDGIDGTGKTTQAAKLVKRLNGEGFKAELTKEPTDGPIGSIIRSMLSSSAERPSLLSLQLLFTADRNEHVIAYKGVMESKDVILVSDRYYLSTVAYGSAAGISAEYLKLINSIFPKPDLSIILEAKPEIVMGRIDRRGQKEIFEHVEFLNKVQSAYRSEFPDAVFIDATKPLEAVHEDVYAVVKRFLRR
ncbi:dTMP kinase [Candidatus Marsarchaeota archaeon]|nr:dTMP kinase [Candidatus Marsarchaeota archaeon]